MKNVFCWKIYIVHFVAGFYFSHLYVNFLQYIGAIILHLFIRKSSANDRWFISTRLIYIYFSFSLSANNAIEKCVVNPFIGKHVTSFLRAFERMNPHISKRLSFDRHK